MTPNSNNECVKHQAYYKVSRRKAHTVRRMKRQARRSAALFRENVIRPLNQYIEQMFLLFGGGLYVKGSEIRGTRHPVPPVPEHLIPEFPLPRPASLAELWPQPHTNPTRERERKPHHPNTNPTRERGRTAYHLNTDPNRQQAQQTRSPYPPPAAPRSGISAIC